MQISVSLWTGQKPATDLLSCRYLFWYINVTITIHLGTLFPLHKSHTIIASVPTLVIRGGRMSTHVISEFPFLVGWKCCFGMQ